MTLGETTESNEVKPCCFSLWQWSGGACPLIAIICQPLLLGARGTEQDGWLFFPKGRLFQHRMKYDRSEEVANICEVVYQNLSMALLLQALACVL
ncbi:hypothetical protein EVA_05672 [gut metagenome]|uniref:Uncharacterized protein n=1 Tax=gut metagenome TaxID=749906 RepID=J9GTX5_9ZZZZ